MSGRELKELLVVLDDGETFSALDGSVVLAVAPGDERLLADGAALVEPLNIYDLSDPVDLRRLADDIEARS